MHTVFEELFPAEDNPLIALHQLFQPLYDALAPFTQALGNIPLPDFSSFELPDAIPSTPIDAEALLDSFFEQLPFSLSLNPIGDLTTELHDILGNIAEGGPAPTVASPIEALGLILPDALANLLPDLNFGH